MQINPISNTSFYSKRYVSLKTKECAQNLLEKMNQKTLYTENPDKTFWISDILASIELDKNNIKFSDNRLFITQTNEKTEIIPDCTLTMGKNYINFNSKTGEILKYNKGAFSSWKSFLCRAEGYISKIQNSFDNDEVVIKNRFKIKIYTKERLKVLQNSIK